jgi:N-acetylmuramic acid 6-phosphate etherase
VTRRATPEASDLDGLATEATDPAAADLDLRSTSELVSLMSEADARVPAAVAAASPAIAAAIDAVTGRLASGGRLVYVGAGTSGGLAAVDAFECEATFGVRSGLVVALVAGAADDDAAAQQQAEDDGDAGARGVHDLAVGARDAVVGLSASGRTPFTRGALEAARAAGATTIAVVSVTGSPLAELAEHEIMLDVGPEVIAGSTRLKAGTAQKLVLNMISTIAMVRLGKTYGNLMVDVVATNDKLRARVRRIVAVATGAPDEQAEEALSDAEGDARVAIVMLGAGVDVETARARLAAAAGNVRKALTG